MTGIKREFLERICLDGTGLLEIQWTNEQASVSSWPPSEEILSFENRLRATLTLF